MQFINIEEKGPDGMLCSCQVGIDTGGILFIAGGVFEDLYDMVFDCVIVHGKNFFWKLVIKVDGIIEWCIVFQFGNNLIYQDFFDYGIMLQFLVWFDLIVIFCNLNVRDLVIIFKDIFDVQFLIVQEYF